MLRSINLSRLASQTRRLGSAVAVSSTVHATLLVALALVVLERDDSHTLPPALEAHFAPHLVQPSFDELALGPAVDDRVAFQTAPQPAATILPESLSAEPAAAGAAMPAPQLHYAGRSAGASDTTPAGNGQGTAESAQGAASQGTAAPATADGGQTGGNPGKAKNAAGQTGNSFFGLQAYGNRIVFVVDISGSMHGKRFRRMRRELRRTIEELTESQQFFVVFFNHQALPMPATDLVRATPDNVAQVERWLQQVETGGGTNPLPGLLIALNLKPDSIYLLTDGKFDPQTIWAVAQAEPPQPIPIYTIGFASKSAERLLTAIAEETGGAYRFVK